MAVGTTLQRRVSDYYLLMTVIILFLTLGVMVHISNVLRLLHLYTQTKQATQEQAYDAQKSIFEGTWNTEDGVIILSDGTVTRELPASNIKAGASLN